MEHSDLSYVTAVYLVRQKKSEKKNQSKIIFISQNHRITQLQVLEETSGDQVQTPC